MIPFRDIPRNEASSRLGFAANRLDRQGMRRSDAAWIEACRAHGTARFVLLSGDEPLRRDGSFIFAGNDLPIEIDEEERVFLGEDATGAFFAAELPEDDALLDLLDLEPVPLRAAAASGAIAPEMLGIIAEARSLLAWHRRHRFCSNCGQPTGLVQGGWRRECPDCGAAHFPRTDPVVIMLVADAGRERLLLGRSLRFSPGLYSCLAGYMEPGETIEDAVRREIMEEAGISVTDVRYAASQPWPFPSTLMIGCVATALTEDISLDDDELEDARWFSRAEVAAMLEMPHGEGLCVPPPHTIAHALLRQFLAEAPAPSFEA